MSKIVKSAKGETIDFDLLKIKAQMANTPKSTTVKAREDFIDKKLKRRIQKLKTTTVTQAAPVDVEPTGLESLEEDNNQSDKKE